MQPCGENIALSRICIVIGFLLDTATNMAYRFVLKCGRSNAEVQVTCMCLVTGLALAEKPTFPKVFILLTVNSSVPT